MIRNKTTELHGIKFLPVSIEEALQEVTEYISRKEGDFFCFVNVHLVMESQKDSELKKVFHQSAANFPDGMGVAWALRLIGKKFNGRVRGTDCMLKLCCYASERNLGIFLYGNTKETLEMLKRRLKLKFPQINIVGAIAPPFRLLTKEEDENFVKQINDARTDILFVSLGAPKQEKWMAEHKGRITAIQLGVGAAFDFITGNVKQAPLWMQKTGLEWLYRLPQQPQKTICRMALVPSFAFRTLMEVKQKG